MSNARSQTSQSDLYPRFVCQQWREGAHFLIVDILCDWLWATTQLLSWLPWSIHKFGPSEETSGELSGVVRSETNPIFRYADLGSPCSWCIDENSCCCERSTYQAVRQCFSLDLGLIIECHRTAAFAKACLAFSHITIPSLESIIERLELYLLCAQASLLNQFLPQTDTFVKTAISLIPDCARESPYSSWINF